MSEARLVDREERARIRGDLASTLIVEAAAGTGKTSELVQRIVRVVSSGAGKLSSIVAVTFTEKAAGEMKLRIRTELDRALSRAGADGEERARLSTALSELEAAKIGTIHALAADLLRAHPVQADVDPAFEVADGERARFLLRRAFDQFLAERLADPPEGIRRVLSRAALDENHEDPRVALFNAASKRVETRDFDAPYRRDPIERPALIADVMGQLGALAALEKASGDGRDPLRRGFALLARRLRSVRGANADVCEAFLRSVRRERDVWDRKGHGKLYGSRLARADVLAQVAAVRTNLEAAVTALDADLAACLSRELQPVSVEFERQKAEHGVLDFFDLLLRARNMLRDDRAVRAALQARLSHLFVDEFQDTDPVQAEILLLLAADRDDESDPFAARPVPGKLFVVGDPKQSIYRFRRADVLLYERVKRHLLAHGAQLVTLSTSFRSLPAIQSLVNAAFAPLMAGDVALGQASYVPLSPHRPARARQPALIALPVPEPYGFNGKVTKKAVNGSLPDAVGALLEFLLLRSGYTVHEGGEEVPLAARHVCLLFRRFRAYDGDVTRDYVRALEARRIPHVLAGGRAFYAREEVIALCAVLRAIEWPDDALAVYATLRGPFVAFSDDALLAFRAAHGTLSPFAATRAEKIVPGDDVQREILDVLALIVALHRARNRRPIATTIGKFLSALRVHAGVAMWPTGEQSLGNLYKLASLARSYEGRRRATSFRGFIAWLEQSAGEGGAADATVVEESSDGVRIMTVHAAKGLEFPVVVLCDPTAPNRPEYASRFVDPERKLWAQSLCDADPIELVEQRDAVRGHDQAEIVRLLYVAATRARELLVVPVTGAGPIEGWVDVLSPALFPAREARREPQANVAYAAFGKSSVVKLPIGHEQLGDDLIQPGEHAPERGAHRVVFWDPNLLELGRGAQGGLMQAELLRVDEQGLNDARGSERYAAFRAARAAESERAALPSVSMRVVTEHALSEGGELPALALYDTDVDRGLRAHGTRFGSLVHALLQHAPLRAEEPELRALAQYLGRGVLASADEVTQAVASVRRALAHPLLERARAAEARGELFRETPVTTRDHDGALLDGVVDLAFREHGAEGPRMILVDYKTDVAIADLSHYQRQLAGYAAAITRALGEPVECVLLRV